MLWLTARKPACSSHFTEPFVVSIAAAEGRGIFLASSVEQLQNKGKLVVQHYLANPCVLTAHTSIGLAMPDAEDFDIELAKRRLSTS